VEFLFAELVVGNAVRRVMHLIREVAASEGLQVTSDQVFSAANPQPCASLPGICTLYWHSFTLVYQLLTSAVCTSPKQPWLQWAVCGIMQACGASSAHQHERFLSFPLSTCIMRVLD